MECNLIGTLTFYKFMKIVPNFSELEREFKKDRHTIKKMYAAKEEVKIRKKRSSMFDPFLEDIKELLSNKAVLVKAAYWYLKNEKNLPGTYNGFKSYVLRNKIRSEVLSATPHPLYETDPGEVTQNDWVEDIKLTTINKKVLCFNLFSSTLGYSRFHNFEYSEFKTEEDYKRCTTHFFKKIGGLTKNILTDNMPAIVNVSGGNKRKHQSIMQFEKDIGVPIKLCKVRTPETKGKDETSNKFVRWLKAYDGKIRDKEHLLEIIERFNVDINKQVNTRTNMPPLLLFQKEKEYLRPLPNKKLLETYEDEAYKCKVPSTFLIDYKGAKYSVPPNFISKTVLVKERGDKIYIYHHEELISEFEKAKAKSINYNEEHYKNGLKGKFKDSDDIVNVTSKNLAKFKDLGEK